MPTSTYTPLGSFTTTGSTSTITFTSIGSYRDYVIQGITTQGGYASWAIRLNSDTSSSSPTVYMITYDATTNLVSGSFSSTGNTWAGNIASNESVVTAHIMDASATDKHKTILGRWSNSSRPDLGMAASRWPSTAAVTSITVLVPSGSFSSGTILSLYGIAA